MTDLKPANLFLVPDKESPSGERAKILDFGIAKFYDSTKSGEKDGSDPAHHLTTVGKLLGTPAYMSPEQCSGAEHVDGAIDVYSLGVILYQLLSGKLPFEAPHAVLIMTKHIVEPPPPLSAVELALPQPLCALVHEMLAKSPKARPSIGQVVVRIEQLLETETGASSHQWRSQHRRRWPGRKRWQRYLLGTGIVLASFLLILIGQQRRALRRSRAAAISAPQVSPPTQPTLPANRVPASATPIAPSAEPAAATPVARPGPPASGHKRVRSAKATARDRGREPAVPTAPPAPTPPAPPHAVEVPILR